MSERNDRTPPAPAVSDLDAELLALLGRLVVDSPELSELAFAALLARGGMR